MKSEIVLSVFYNGQFFTALFERNDGSGYSATQKNFVLSPSDNEILGLVLNEYHLLSFSAPSQQSGEIIKPAKNPKKRQREAARANENVCASTKAQQALKMQHEELAVRSKSLRKEDEMLAAERKYELHMLKKKQKHKGR